MLSRCDLMTETVGEFAEMQGVMGRYQAQRDGEPGDIALAMDEFYMPRFFSAHLFTPCYPFLVKVHRFSVHCSGLVGFFLFDMNPEPVNL